MLVKLTGRSTDPPEDSERVALNVHPEVRYNLKRLLVEPYMFAVGYSEFIQRAIDAARQEAVNAVDGETVLVALTEDEAIALRTAIAAKREYAVPQDLESGLEKLEVALESMTDHTHKMDGGSSWERHGDYDGMITVTLTEAEAEAITETTHIGPIDHLDDAIIARRKIKAALNNTPLSEWCPVCHSYHNNVGVKTDAGKLIRQCPSLSPTDPRNIFKNYPGR